MSLTHQRILLLLALLAVLVSPLAAAAAHPSLTGNPQELQDQQRDAVLKTALRQRSDLPVARSNSGRRLGGRRLPSSSDDHKHDSDDKDDKPPPPPPSSGGSPYPGYYPPSTGGTTGYYPPPPPPEGSSGGGGGGGGGGGYYPPPPPPQSQGSSGGGGGGGYYPPEGGYSGTGGADYPPPLSGGGGGGGYPQSSTTSPQQQQASPQNDDIPLLDDAMFDDAFYTKDACQLVTFNESFYFTVAPTQLGVGGSNDASAVGSQFLFSQNIFTPTGSMINDTLLSGICTRTSTKGFLGSSGAGVCQFNFVDVHGNYTIAAQGHLDTIASQTSAGNLVVTGGSGSMASVIGEMTVVPVDESGMFSVKDIFTGIYAYYIQAAFGVIMCPTPLAGSAA